MKQNCKCNDVLYWSCPSIEIYLTITDITISIELFESYIEEVVEVGINDEVMEW